MNGRLRLPPLTAFARRADSEKQGKKGKRNFNATQQPQQKPKSNTLLPVERFQKPKHRQCK